MFDTTHKIKSVAYGLRQNNIAGKKWQRGKRRQGKQSSVHRRTFFYASIFLISFVISDLRFSVFRLEVQQNAGAGNHQPIAYHQQPAEVVQGGPAHHRQPSLQAPSPGLHVRDHVRSALHLLGESS